MTKNNLNIDKWIFLFISFFLLGKVALAQGQKKIAIIPEPVSVIEDTGYFYFPEKIFVETSKGQDLGNTFTLLKQKLLKTGSEIVRGRNERQIPTIKLMVDKDKDAELGKEGYRLSSNSNQIVIKANRPAGLFYGVQTLLQLLPKEIEGDNSYKNIDWKIPRVEIVDYPQFEWRGLLFDVARHFFTVEEVKEIIDQMVRFKLNLLHLHLTDDQGWRIEIKGLPRLTDIGAWNVKKIGVFGYFSPPDADAARDYGGFYTQKDIKEIVKYAQDRFVNILPEIDVPGHSLAAVVSYPKLSCTEAADTYQVNSGEPLLKFENNELYALVDNTLCPAKEGVYSFLDEVYTQIADLFPFEYIDVGGDEAAHNFWKKSEEIDQLMKKKQLKDYDEVRAYFMSRVEDILKSKGKKMIGWDEILSDRISPSAAIMSRTGTSATKKDIKMGHEVVLTPVFNTYLDYMQGDPFIEPPVYAKMYLKQAYDFNPTPEGVDISYIKGGQGNLWTEQVYNLRHAEYMIWPREMAIAEVLWSPKNKQDWKSFINRLEHYFGRMRLAQIKYAPSLYDPSFEVSWSKNNRLLIKLTTEIEGLDIYYSFDNSFPDSFYPKYNKPLIHPEDAVMLRVVTYKGDKQVGRMVSVSIKKLEERANQ